MESKRIEAHYDGGPSSAPKESSETHCHGRRSRGDAPPPRICLGFILFRICHQPFVTSAFRPRSRPDIRRKCRACPLQSLLPRMAHVEDNSLSVRRNTLWEYWEQVEEEHIEKVRRIRRNHAARLSSYRRRGNKRVYQFIALLLSHLTILQRTYAGCIPVTFGGTKKWTTVVSTWILGLSVNSEKTANVGVHLQGNSHTDRTSYYADKTQNCTNYKITKQ